MTTRGRGFTLIEMMISIFIALIIFTIGFTAISSTIQARRESESRIRATENARFFFDLLQKDLANAYPLENVTLGVNVDLPEIVQLSTGMTVTNDRIEFFTHADHRDLTDQYVFVRYYVNSFGQLCRKASQGLTPDAAFVPFTPALLTDDSSALFDQTYALLVSTGQWQESSKTMNLSSALPCPPTTTHLQVQLFFLGYNGTNPDKSNTPATKRVFMKTIPVPDIFRPTP